MKDVNVVETIRNHLLDFNVDEALVVKVSESLECSKLKAKELIFRFHYFPTEEFMQKCLDGNHQDIFTQK